MKKSVLFVCMGNICRSPTGEAVLKSLAKKNGLDRQLFIDSAGTIGYHTGDRADGRMRTHASKRGYQLDSIARQFVTDDFEKFDLILAMDRQNLSDILHLDPEEKFRDKVFLFCDFVPDTQEQDVPDPYYGGSQGFERVIDLVELGCEGILDRLLDGE